MSAAPARSQASSHRSPQGEGTPVSPSARAPHWRALALLAVAVLGLHTLLLVSRPGRFGPAFKPAPPTVRPLLTRRIENPPPAPEPIPASPLAVPRPKAPTKPDKPPVIRSKVPAAQQESAQSAIDLIAPSTPTASAGSAETPALTAGAAAEPAEPATTEATASAPATPAGPSQTAVTAMALPDSARLEYKMTGNARGLSYHAKGELDWHHDGRHYDARMLVSALFLGSRSLASQGQVSAQGLAPTRFADKSRNELAAHFEPDKGQISFSANTPTLPWVQGAQDRVSVFLQLGGMLAGNPAGFAPGSSITLYTVGPREADYWTFAVGAEEKIVLPYGELAAIRLARQPRREFDQTVEIWFAPSLGYLPVRSKITQAGGDFVEQQLSALIKP